MNYAIRFIAFWIALLLTILALAWLKVLMVGATNDWVLYLLGVPLGFFGPLAFDKYVTRGGRT